MRRAVLAFALLVSASVVSAQAPQDTLARRVTLNVRDISLRDALDRIAALSGTRISYSGDNLPLDRRVAVQSSALLVLDVLRDLLRAFAVDATPIAPDHIVLTPRTATAVDSLAGSVAVLDRVVVTGSVLGVPERPLPIALDVVAGREIERRDQRAISQVFDGSVPGIWVWEQAPTSMTARYGSIRGASSFGVSFPKVYVDGIEVANPLLLTQVTPELIERVEVIRGPQGAALYGSDAISGVVNIVSRHEGGGADGLNIRLRSQAGYAGSYGAGAVAVQEHALSIRSGTNLKNAGLTLGGSTSGNYIPDAYSRQFRAIADGRLILARTTMTGNVRFYDKSAGVPASPLLPANKARRFGADSQPQTLRMYTVGGTISHLASETWTVAATAGVDGYRLSNVSSDGSPIPFFVDSALRAASGSVSRATIRGSAVGNFGAAQKAAATLTFAAEQSLLSERSLEELPPLKSGSGNGGPRDLVLDWTTNTGFISQVNVAIRDALFLTGGVRFEHIDVTLGNGQLATLPMLGAAVVRDGGLLTTKLRVAYGRGIRAARSSPRASMADLKHRLFNPTLKPEEQAGVEAGVDFWVARRIGVHVTRFDQRARGLVQLVSLADTARSGAVYYLHQLQNVGEITNAGWEAQTDLSLGALTLGGAASFVDSRVRRIATGYTGDMRVGDRMLGVPARTLSATASLVQRRYQFSTTLSRAYDWINYDRLGIANCVLTLQCVGDKDLAGTALRRWWINYPGATRLRGSFSVDLPRGLALTATGDNLLDRQRGEPDSITIVPGRTITLGMRARF
jgi:outer membrane receptor protein involved in Fe transport